MVTTFRINAHGFIAVLLLSIGLCAHGCSTTETEPACSWVVSPDECIGIDDGKSDGNDEVGESGGESDSGPACISEPDGTTRTLHQCNGNIAGSISFTALGKTCAETLGAQSACEEIHSFGAEPYELSKVVACCDPWGPDSDIDEYLTYCSVDMVQQICSSISTRLKKLIDDGELPATAETTAIQKWIATNQGECYKALWGGNMADQPGEVVGSWAVPNKLAWKTLVKDFTVTIDASAATDVKLPEDLADYIDCVDNNYNNTEIFESNTPSPPGITNTFALASAAEASLLGPFLWGGRVSGAEHLASQASGCTSPWCSNARITVASNRGTWTLEDMNLFVDGTTTLDNGELSLDVDCASIRLYGISPGVIVEEPSGAAVYEVPPGTAHFLVAGASSQGIGLYLLTNSSPIRARESGTGWSFDQFVLELVDGNGAAWMLRLPTTIWK